MKPAFPGMNPYLEDPEIWVEVHSWLIVLLARSLNPQLTPKYRAAVERRVYADAVLVGIPDIAVFQKSQEPNEIATTSLATTPLATTPLATAPLATATPQRVTVPMLEEVRESYLTIREVTTGQVVTVIELLSPKNKRSGEGRNQYNAKRHQILSSATHLIEIDLLRTGESPAVAGAIASDYRILVSRSQLRPAADLYPFSLRDRIPVFPLPLQPGDEEPLINLAELLDQVYDEAALDLAIDYHAAPQVKLKEEDWNWVRSCLGLG